MDVSVHIVHELVSGVRPWDHLETEHRAETLNWLETTNDVFRRAKPATPDKHLFSYVVMIDPGSSLLVDHINARFWLPPGGHVEPASIQRSLPDERLTKNLGIDPMFAEPSGQPSVRCPHVSL